MHQLARLCKETFPDTPAFSKPCRNPLISGFLSLRAEPTFGILPNLPRLCGFQSRRLPLRPTDTANLTLRAADLADSAPRRYPQIYKKFIFLEWKSLKKAAIKQKIRKKAWQKT